jgi:hypothetical protein
VPFVARRGGDRRRDAGGSAGGSLHRGLAMAADRRILQARPAAPEPAMPRPLSKDDLLVLSTIVRAQPRDNPPDEAVLARLAAAGLVQNRRGRWVGTDKGKAEIEKRRVAREEPPAAADAKPGGDGAAGPT